MAKDVIHISDKDAASDFASLLAKVRSGVEIVIEINQQPVAILQPAVPKGRLLSESLAIARARGSKATLDEGFAKDVEDGIEERRQPLNPPEWD
jgi:antitoxin (DNA-binding transcriptional repressor) of toxin-antitoxin stability system